MIGDCCLKMAYLRWSTCNIPVFGLNSQEISLYQTTKEDISNGENKSLPDSQYLLSSENLPIDNFNPKGLLDQILQDENQALLQELTSFKLVYARDMNSKNEVITLSDFETLNLIGKGSISNVYLVKRLEDGQPFAMKSIRKDLVLDQDLFESTKLEKELLIRMTSPFFVNLHYAFHSKTKILFIMDFVRGGDLLMHLLNLGTFTEEIAKFICAQLVLALGYLHQNEVVYRDLKLENILLNQDGYISLVDFGISKRLENQERTFSVRGTPEYMAPEILTKAGHSFPVDWWALGTLTYEMVFGQAPFFEEDKTLMFKKIMRQKLRFPKDVQVTSEFKDFISLLLHKDPQQRLGINGHQEVMEHPFFSNLNFKALESKTLEPPYKPQLTQDAFDVSNFEQELTSRTTFQDGHLSIGTANLIKQRQSVFKQL
eukprot:403355062